MCIKKSDSSSLNAVTAAAIAAVTKGINKSATTSGRSRKSSRNTKQRIKLPDSNDEADEINYEPKRKKERSSRKQSSTAAAAAGSVNDGAEHQRPVVEQSIWGRELPEPVLLNVRKREIISKLLSKIITSVSQFFRFSDMLLIRRVVFPLYSDWGVFVLCGVESP